MRSTRLLGAAVAASLLLGATACGDDEDDEAATTATTEEPQGPTAIEVTLTPDGIEGLPTELPAGLVEITLINETGGFGSLDITRVTAGTTEDEFVAGLQPVFEGGAFPDYFESNAGVEAGPDGTAAATVVLREGEHIAWSEIRGPEGEEGEQPAGEEEADSDATTTTAVDGSGPTTSTPEAEGEETTTTTTSTTSTTTTTVAGADEGAAGAGEPAGTLTGVAAQAEPEEPAEDEPLAEEPEETGDPEAAEEGETGEEAGSQIVTEALTVTAGDEDAELPAADGEIVATDYEFAATLDGPGTINFRNDGPQQFHHAVLMDFGTNDPADVEAVFPAFLESEGDPSTIPGAEALDFDQVDFEFGGSGVFGPDGMAGTFEADIVEGNTYAIVCFLQDREGSPPHAIAYDMWDVVQAGEAADTTETTEG